MRRLVARGALVLLALVSSSYCTDTPIAPIQPAPAPSLALSTAAVPSLVISQIYGGGGNSGATLKNDFIELFNPGGQAVSVDGWSVQYASATGTSWQVTALSGTIQPGAYYLVQEAVGSGGTVSLPTPNASGTISMSATAGKVALSMTTTPLTGTCPAAVNAVSFGSTATDCGGAERTPNPSNTNAVLRLEAGCKITGKHSQDFAAGAPTPRNSASPIHLCPNVQPVGPLDHVTMAGPASVVVGNNIQLTATPQDASNQTVGTATVTWSSSDAMVASVSAQGVVTGVKVSTTPVTITATAVDGEITKTDSVVIAVTAPAIHWIDVSSSAVSFPAGFQTQLFATARTGNGGTIVEATFTFDAVDPQIATVETVANTGIVTGVSGSTTKPGFRITATPIGGGVPYVFTARPFTIETPAPAPTSIYADNDEFGAPTPAGANLDDLLIERPQYTLSYNASRGTPNWVSYELDSRQMVAGQDRCNCFTADPRLPADKVILTSDYTNGGYDRGHMVRSADRTAGNVDNATTFYLTNVIPQTSDLNQGVWARFENTLADSAREGRAVYIVTGPLYSRSKPLTFLKSEGKVAIPDSTWKVAFIGARDGDTPFTRGTIDSWDDLAGTTVLAVNMPNITGVRNDSISKYLTTVDRIEASTGYDILSLLATSFQGAVEAGDRSPTAAFALSGQQSEGSAVTFDASGSSDPDLGRTDLDLADALSYAWSFSDGTSATGKLVTHTFAHYGAFIGTLTVSDTYGWESKTSKTVNIANVAPTIAPIATVTILEGETYSASGSFTDPGVSSWSATVDYDDGAGAQSLALSGKSFALSHAYATAGSYDGSVRVSDGLATSTRSFTVVVENAGDGIGNLSAMIAALGASLNNGESNSLQAKLRAAETQLRRDGTGPAANLLQAFVNELEAMVASDRLSTSAAVPIIAYAQRVIASLGG